MQQSGLVKFTKSFPIMDEPGRLRIQEHYGNFAEQSHALRLTMLPKASGDRIEVCVVVSGVAENLKGALGGDVLEECTQFAGIKAAGGGDAEGSAGGEAGWDDAMESGLEAVEKGDLQAALEAGMAPGVCWFEGVAQGSDRGGLHNPEKGAGHRRKDVGVLVRVQMRDTNAGVLNFANLGQGLTLDL